MHPGFSKQLRFEMLEAKRTLTANLSVAVVDGDLVVTGDANDNRFILQSGAADGQDYEFKNIGDISDTINGGMFTENHFFSGVTGDIIINLGDGNDWVNIEGTNGVSVLEMPGDLRIDMGNGDDQIALGMGDGILSGLPLGPNALPLDVAGDLAIDMGAGADKTWITATTVGDDFSYADTQGDAFLSFVNTLAFTVPVENYIGDDLSIITGGGIDDVNLNEVHVADDLLVSVGDGNDSVGFENVEVIGSTLASLGGGDFNSGDFEASYLGSSFGVLASGAENFIVVGGVTTSSSVVVLTSSGTDNVTIAGVTTGTVLVSTGGGSDTVGVVASTLDYLFVNVGSGDDALTIAGTTVDEFALLYGGSGDDTLTLIDNGDIVIDLAFENYG